VPRSGTPQGSGTTQVVGRTAVDEHATGDIGALDGDGFLALRGRQDDVICLASGHKVIPQFVEDELLRLPEVRDCAVLADSRSRLRALIVPAPGASPTAAVDSVRRLDHILIGPIAPMPVALPASASLPRTPHGKLIRRQLPGMLLDHEPRSMPAT